jgi:hypothetical protein
VVTGLKGNCSPEVRSTVQVTHRVCTAAPPADGGKHRHQERRRSGSHGCPAAEFMPEGPRVVTSRMGSPDLGDVERAEAHGKAVTIWDLHTTPVNRSSSVLIPATRHSEGAVPVLRGKPHAGPRRSVLGPAYA